MKARRWGDNDRYFGPFTYARDKSYRRWQIMLRSGTEDWPGCSLNIGLGTHTIILALPPIVPMERKKVFPKWDAATIARLGRDWYWAETPREYGFYIVEGHLCVHYGRQTHDSRTEQSWGCFLPWRSWRHIRHSVYDLTGAHFADLPQRRRGLRLGDAGFSNHWEASRALEEACPSAKFLFRDFDGEEIVATTRIEEREWRLGEGSFKWLSWFAKPKVRRSLDLRFSNETGRRKGSWKGGTIGHGIDMLPGELHEAAFRRYCEAHEMRFVASCDGAPSRPTVADSEESREEP